MHTFTITQKPEMEICLNTPNSHNNQFFSQPTSDCREIGVLLVPSERGDIYEGLNTKHSFFNFIQNPDHLPQDFQHEKDHMIDDKDSLDSTSKKPTTSTESVASHSKSDAGLILDKECLPLANNPILELNETIPVRRSGRALRPRLQPEIKLATAEPRKKQQSNTQDTQTESQNKNDDVSPQKKAKQAKQAEPGILDLDREIALLKRAGKKVKEFFEFNLQEVPRTKLRNPKKAPEQRNRKPGKPQSDLKQEVIKGEEETEAKVEQIVSRSSKSKKISKNNTSINSKLRVMKKLANKKFKLNYENEDTVPSLKVAKKEIDDRNMVLESTSEGSGMPHTEEETDILSKERLSEEIKSATLESENSDVGRTAFFKEQKSQSGKSAQQENIQNESVPIVLKAKEDVHERIGNYYQAEITPLTIMNYHPKRNFKQVWVPGVVSDELIAECDQIAETTLTIKNINQGKLIKLMAACENSKEKFQEFLEVKKNWSRNQLKLKRVYNESK